MSIINEQFVISNVTTEQYKVFFESAFLFLLHLHYEKKWKK